MDEAVLKRVMPNDTDAEKTVIGSMLMDKEAIMTASELLTEEDFYQPQYGLIFKGILELFNTGIPAEPGILINKMKELGAPPELISVRFFAELLDMVETSANVKYYAQIVADKAVLRKMIKLNDQIANACYMGRESVADIMDAAEKQLFQLLQSRGGGDFVPIKQVVMNALEKIERASKTKGNITGIECGFTDIDRRLSGLQPSDLILIAARPSMGKTAFVLNIAQHVAFKKNVTTAIFSLEMSKEQLVNRLFSLESLVDAQALRNGNLTDTDWERLIESAGVIGKSNLIIDDTPSISIGELRTKCRKYKLEHNLGVVMIDYLQLMSGGGKSESRQQEISEISRSLKALARELSVPVIALSQLSRAVEQRPDKRPIMSDLRESGAIEQDADVIMFIYRDDYYNKDSDEKNVAEIITAKQRNGPIGTDKLVWRPNYTRFENFLSENDPLNQFIKHS